MDRFLFWLGILSGIFISWLFGKIRPFLMVFLDSIRKSLQAFRHNLQTSIESRYLSELQNYAQRLHMAAPLSPLDKILIPPLLLAPPPPTQPEVSPPQSDLTSTTLPYLPDWPELVRNYGADTLTLEQALSAGANLLLIGKPGSGKTVALASLASRIAQRKVSDNNTSEPLPILVHACDIQIAENNQQDPINVISEAVSSWVSRFTKSRLLNLFNQAFHDGNVFLLFDGMDELSIPEQQKFENFLLRLLKAFPAIQIVTTANPEYFGRLMYLGFVPLPMATWNENRRLEFLNLWDKLWQDLVSSRQEPVRHEVDPLLVKGWLIGEKLGLSPIEFTLKYWAAFAGDALGSRLPDSIHAHVRRMVTDIPGALQSLEIIAQKILLNQKSSFSIAEAQTWITSKGYTSGYSSEDEDDVKEIPGALSEKPPNLKGINLSQVLSDLITRGLLVKRLDSRFSFAHPLIPAYLTASKFVHARDLSRIIEQPEWSGRNLILELIPAFGGLPMLSSRYMKATDDPLLRDPLHLARWIQNAPENDTEISTVLRYLADLTVSDGLPRNLRARLITSFAILNEPGSDAFLRQLLSNENPEVRFLAALGCGALGNSNSIDQLTSLLQDQSTLVSRAACLALVAIGDTLALEAVTGELLHGKDDMRQIAAEALANHPHEGHPILRDGSEVEDLLVRRAVVFGLRRIKKPWAQEILRKLQDQDGQWVVRSAATQAIEETNTIDPHIPQPPKKLREIKWLRSFVEEHAIDISAYKKPVDLLLQVFELGTKDQQQTALEICRYYRNDSLIAMIYRFYNQTGGELHEVALDTLWYLCASGLQLPIMDQQH